MNEHTWQGQQHPNPLPQNSLSAFFAGANEVQDSPPPSSAPKKSSLFQDPQQSHVADYVNAFLLYQSQMAPLTEQAHTQHKRLFDNPAQNFALALQKDLAKKDNAPDQRAFAGVSAANAVVAKQMGFAVSDDDVLSLSQAHPVMQAQVLPFLDGVYMDRLSDSVEKVATAIKKVGLSNLMESNVVHDTANLHKALKHALQDTRYDNEQTRFLFNQSRQWQADHQNVWGSDLQKEGSSTPATLVAETDQKPSPTPHTNSNVDRDNARLPDTQQMDVKYERE